MAVSLPDPPEGMKYVLAPTNEVKITHGTLLNGETAQLHGCVSSAKRIYEDPVTGMISIRSAEGESAPPPR